MGVIKVYVVIMVASWLSFVGWNREKWKW